MFNSAMFCGGSKLILGAARSFLIIGTSEVTTAGILHRFRVGIIGSGKVYGYETGTGRLLIPESDGMC